MKLDRRGLVLSDALLWVGLFVCWALTGALLPVPPWRAAEVLAREDAAAARLAEEPPRIRAWSMDLGAPEQASALGPGWSDDEAFLANGRRVSFVWIDGPRAEIRFGAPDWPDARLSLEASALPALAPLSVTVLLDGAPRGRFLAGAAWTLFHLRLGPVSPGSHVLALEPARLARPPGEVRSLSLAVDGIAVAPVSIDEPSRDRGVFRGWLPIAFRDRPVLFVSSGAEKPALPAGSLTVPVAPGLLACYGFGVGGGEGRLSTLLAAVHGLAAAGLVLLGGGLLWAGWLGSRGAARLLATLGLSSFALVLVFLALRLLGRPPGPLGLACGLALLGAAPLLARPHGRSLRLAWSVLLPTAAGVAVLTAFAVAVVPALEDQDMEVQETAHALATRQVPLALTNRGTTSFFAHPPLLHLWEAASFTLAGELERMAPYEAAAREARARPGGEAADDAPLSARPHYLAWKRLFRRFLAEPHLWTTRQANVLASALALLVLARLAAALTGSAPAGAALGLLLLSFPEVLVRGAYGGYFAVTTLLGLLVVAVVDAPSRPGTLAGSGALAFLANQKGLLAPLGWLLAAPRGSGVRRVLPALGAVLAAVAFVAYGLAVDPQSFLHDFLVEHVLRRLEPDLRFAADAARWYPSIPGLWVEFARRYGAAFLLWAGLAAGLGLRRPRPAVRAASASVLLGALAFSLTDWRQTKHLALLVPLAIVAIAGSWPVRPLWRRVLLGLVVVLVLRNLWVAWPLLGSFESLRPSTSW